MHPALLIIPVCYLNNVVTYPRSKLHQKMPEKRVQLLPLDVAVIWNKLTREKNISDSFNMEMLIIHEKKYLFILTIGIEVLPDAQKSCSVQLVQSTVHVLKSEGSVNTEEISEDREIRSNFTEEAR